MRLEADVVRRTAGDCSALLGELSGAEARPLALAVCPAQ